MGISRKKKPVENRTTNEINPDDLVLIYKDSCLLRIKYEDFIKKISLGGFSICESVLNCWQDMGDFEDTPHQQDTPPEFTDLYISLRHGQRNFVLDKTLFLNNYHDAEGDAFNKIVITGGDLSGITFRGQPVYIGLVITADELEHLEYDTKNTDSSYQQVIEIDVYDENNIKAI